MQLDRVSIKIIPETPMDVAYICDTLGMDDPVIPYVVHRVNYWGTSRLAHLLILSRKACPGERVEDENTC